ncbi:AraC family transcriptional regulator [Pelagibius sp.]|uniref:AraC family transcriptional regulator n=1 Tax=Pelagibius sp. TaxID=1931238 RepID=UPI00262482C7|nr:AraC family transcriptional regulator [Pelagibius sp.]
MAYARHRHDTYMVCRTLLGVQAFSYRGVEERSLGGKIVVLHPDEAHDGRAGTEAGFAYRGAYLNPVEIAEAAEALTGRPGPLPFVRQAVTQSSPLAAALREAFQEHTAPLALDGLMLSFAAGLMALDGRPADRLQPRRLDHSALKRARELLDAEFPRTIRSDELERATGLSRFVLARQFRAFTGTSPHRYQVMRRLAFARRRLHDGVPAAAAAAEAGFADQAHLVRWFKSAYGLTPARFAALGRTDQPRT